MVGLYAFIPAMLDLYCYAHNYAIMVQPPFYWFWFLGIFPPHLLTFLSLEILHSAKLIDIYRTRHNITASTGLSDPAVATGISDLIYEMKATKETPVKADALDDDLVNAWAANLGDDGLWGKNAPAVNRVRNF